MPKLSENPNIPVLEGWVNMTEAGELLGFTRSYMYKKANKGGFKTVHKLGTKASYVIATSEIDELLSSKAALE